MTATGTRVLTRSHTATQLSNAVAGAIAEILGHLGISATDTMRRWPTEYDPAIRAWITEGSLSIIHLECTRLNGTVNPIFHFPIEYYDDGSAEISQRHIAQARLWSKVNKVPLGTTFAIKCSYRSKHTDQPYWSDSTLASTDGMSKTNFGTLASGTYASASVTMYTKT